MPRLSKIIIMGTLPLILAAACCCSSSPLIQLLSANLQTPEVSTAIQMGDDTNTPGDGSNNQDITATFVETNTAFPTETSIPTATETAIPTATLTASPVPPASLSADRFVTYDIVQYIDLTAEGHGKATDINLNVALIHSVSPYQEVTSREISPST